MRDPMEVLILKEQEMVRVRREIEALRIAAPLLSDEDHFSEEPKQDLRELVEMP